MHHTALSRHLFLSLRLRDIILTPVSARITLFSDACLRLRALNSRVDVYNEARPPLITPDIRYFHNLFHGPRFPSVPVSTRKPPRHVLDYRIKSIR